MLRFAFALSLFCVPARAGVLEDRCVAEIDLARDLAAVLPPDDLSRLYAEADLNLAAADLSGGEVDDCHDLTTRARRTLLTHPYSLRAGEVLDRKPR